MIMAAARLARRELRGGIKGFRLLVACLALGVAAIAASGSIKASFHRALTEDGRALLGGDAELSQSYHPLTPQQRQKLENYATVSDVASLRAMAKAGASHRLVELKAVDGLYPLAGRLVTEPALPPDQLLAGHGDLWGAIADSHLLEGLWLKVGDVITLGQTQFQIRATISAEPDRVANALAFGPRLIIDANALAATGLIQPGSLIRWSSRLALKPGITTAEVKTALAEAYPDAAWTWRDLADAAPGLGRILDNLAAFLTLVGLTALLVGGIGIANAVKAYLDAKSGQIAVLKALGAPAGQIMLVYGLLIAALSALGIVIGLALGAAAPFALVYLAGSVLPVAARTGFYLTPLAVAASFGVLTALTFAVWPLAQSARISPTALFRRQIETIAIRPGVGAMLIMGASAIGLIGLALGSADRADLAGLFVLAALTLLGLFRALAWGLSRLAAILSGRRHALLTRPAARVALANLHRPGSNVVSMVLSLGLGLTVLVAIAVIEGNLARQFGQTLPGQAPSFYFIDLQPDQSDAFDAVVHAVSPRATIEKAPMVRGRITRLKGVAVDSAAIAPEAQWALRGDRGLTAATTMPAHAVLEAGHWWAPDYTGPPLVSLDAGLARGMGVGVGDSIDVNVLGRDLPLTIASLRQVEWASLNMNFALILSPNALAGAPFIYIATLHAPPAEEGRIERAVVDAFPNVSAIRVKEAVEQVTVMIGHADNAVRLAGLVTLTAGALVLAGAVMAGHRRRTREAVLLKVLGATRGELWRAWLAEFALIGGVTGFGAAAFGSLAAWAVLTQVLHAQWQFLPGLTLATLGACIIAALLAGFAGAFVALQAKAAATLREE